MSNTLDLELFRLWRPPNETCSHPEQTAREPLRPQAAAGLFDGRAWLEPAGWPLQRWSHSGGHVCGILSFAALTRFSQRLVLSLISAVLWLSKGFMWQTTFLDGFNSFIN